MNDPQAQDRPPIAFKIVDAAEWAGAEAAGAYAGSAVDLADGYIHLSTEAQLAETAAKHYAGRGGLLLLTVDLGRLGDTVVWEPSRGGAMFPHIYGPLPVGAVTRARAFHSSPIGGGEPRGGGGGSPQTPASGSDPLPHPSEGPPPPTGED